MQVEELRKHVAYHFNNPETSAGELCPARHSAINIGATALSSIDQSRTGTSERRSGGSSPRPDEAIRCGAVAGSGLGFTPTSPLEATKESARLYGRARQA